MNAVGVIVEYNPFHNGHAFHLQEARKLADAEVVIAVMSGNFLQRGEPAFVSKWKRTEMALLAGADIVFELPYAFATQQANSFASGAVSILEAAGCHSLCFGSESGDIESFCRTISFLETNNDHYQRQVKHYLERGNSYPKASSLAYHDLSPYEELLDMSKPNNILGFQYVKAVQEQNASIKPLTVSRKSADYHDPHFSSDTIASATSIRKALFSEKGELANVKQYMPETSYQVLLDYRQEFGLFHDWENYWPYLRFRILHSTSEELSCIYEVEEGLENRLASAVLVSNSFHEFMNNIKTKRYTWTRLQRACVHILTNTRKNEMNKQVERAEYLRLLGMTSKGRHYLNKNKSRLQLPLISKLSSVHIKHLTLDIRASRIYSMGALGIAQQRLMDMEFKQPPLLLD
ncbi:nucleotidyltransferase [Bacillus sp. DTU_2020_1000418_1_SI_GHA_SEK_038]|uniref:nucleotidyltransferase n=1 Tax=Bacillus sp. DTU_2020_1000418_1_SI_GHA_SEK_038 TaxID=3077585 RepID=UPI0028EE13D4|nr:nucleotidyltransferase [Bacillus sp. DTU_2020_1000418_1_SI_GHA_SEK_038]WNS77064.1 nucleotidyltransferase [Bacillus sp. DTU_2020_1000418_1_SI_GHA_SEK_038]